MEKRVLYNVLRQIQANQQPTGAPDRKYLESLQEIGLIKLGWDNELTDFGREMLQYLEPAW